MTNNGLAGAGVNWTVRLIPVRIRGDRLAIENVNAAAGIDYAVASGAPISNNSWRVADGGYVYSQEIYDAIARAREAGHLFIAAAGNEGTNNDDEPQYPSSYALDNIISALPALIALFGIFISVVGFWPLSAFNIVIAVMTLLVTLYDLWVLGGAAAKINRLTDEFKSVR